MRYFNKVSAVNGLLEIRKIALPVCLLHPLQLFNKWPLCAALLYLYFTLVSCCMELYISAHDGMDKTHIRHWPINSDSLLS